MFASTLKQVEGAPSEYPPAPETLSAAAGAVPAAAIWQRIEAYVAHRWPARSVDGIVEGPGDWVVPLAPASITGVEVWSAANAWETATLAPAPLGGYFLPAFGPYRFTGTVGSGAPNVPASVVEAFRRLAEYMAAKARTAGARSESIAVGEITISHTRSASWLAEAMQNSGAGDLLRTFRNV